MKNLNEKTIDALNALIAQEGQDSFVIDDLNRILGNGVDFWEEEKIKISHFYKEVFGTVLDWATIKTPEYNPSFPRLEYVDSTLTGSVLIATYKRLFGDSSVYNNDYSKDIDAKTKEQQSRREGNYTFIHVGGIEPDKNHLNKSYDDFYQDSNQYMIPYEGIITALRYRF